MNYSYSYCCRSPDLRPQAPLRLLSGSLETLNYWHWAGVSPYTSAFALARTCVFDKQSLSVFCCNHAPYGAWQDILLTYVQLLLPSSLRIVLSIAYVYSTHPPVLVCSTVKIILHYELFPENRNSSLFINIVTRFCIPTDCSIGTSRHNVGTEADLPTSTTLLLRPGCTRLKFSHSVHS